MESSATALSGTLRQMVNESSRASIHVRGDEPKWRNGRRSGLKIRRPKGREGSSPSFGTAALLVMVLIFAWGCKDQAKESADHAMGDATYMASIVEKETAVAEERPLVASVYYNRLQKRIALDADPSIIYAELLAGSYTGALHHDDMQFNSPYNTYKFVGLPPGPIANPGGNPTNL